MYLFPLNVEGSVMKTCYLLTLSVLVCTGCAPTPTSTSKGDALEATQKMVFVKQQKTGLCFGILSSSSVNSSGNSTSMSATLVPCQLVEKFLVDDKK